MKKLTSNILINTIGNIKSSDIGTINITGVKIDSREVTPGDLFFCIKGAKSDGHDYLEQAKANGAVAAVTMQPTDVLPYFLVQDTTLSLGYLAKEYWKENKLPMIGVTGSCGKSTTTGMIAKILEENGDTLFPEKNLNSEYGLPLTIFKLEENHKHAVFEMGMGKPGDIANLVNIANPDVSLVTNVAPCHIEFFGSLDAIASEKGNIYSRLGKGNVAVINTDDVYAPMWLSTTKAECIVTFGLENQGTVGCKNIKADNLGASFDAVVSDKVVPINLQVTGLHNVTNALAAIAATYALGCSVKDIKNGLEKYTGKSRRMQVTQGINNATIIDDTYNANPLAMHAALQTLMQFPDQDKIFVAGDMGELGDLNEQMHTELGQLARSIGINKLYTIGNSTKLTSEAFGTAAKHFTDKGELVNELKSAINEASVVLIKGSNFMGLDSVATALKLEGDS